MVDKNGYCPCGHPQSSPIPHEHDQTDREKAIIKYFTQQPIDALDLLEQFVRGHESGASPPLQWLIKQAKRVLVFRGQVITPEVVIEVLSGVADLQLKSKGVQVTIRDYDDQEDCEVPREYSEQIWDESEVI